MLLRGRKGLIIFSIVAAVGLVAGAASYKTYDYVQHDASFCQSCHIMEEPSRKWSESPHHLVNCHECHRQTIKEGIEQLWFFVTERPHAVVHHPQFDHAVCHQCHLSKDSRWKQVGETAGHKVHHEKEGIDCLSCHSQGIHKIVRPVDACLTCHADKIEGPGKKMAFMHCTDCHNFLAQKGKLLPDREACLQCHQKIQAGRETFPATAPMATLECSVCHKPHEKIRPDREVCLACHSDIKSRHAGMQPAAGCTECHQPHAWKSVGAIQ